ncbi:hypothetical protein QJS10_CPA05g02453 [Acorus calamus]|uniref:Glycosyl transferase 64 domain-containing protein n=1 Tax=Acorus calamus TaxID=4465 RepID=A0AAV9EUT6_ACOCL|nr:hypothetical protein QJS10_CPA05g02453 [Acorus calamus]
MKKAALAILLSAFLSISSALRPDPSQPSDPCDPSSLPDPRTLRSDQLTVLISGYSEHRLPLLSSLAASYASSPLVAAVLILWGNPSTPDETLKNISFSSAAAAPITVIRHPTASLNARFIPRREIRTSAIAVCDDDVEIDEGTLAFAFTVWRSSSRDRLVGLFARSHDLDLSRRSWIYTVHAERFSMVLTKFMILGADYLVRYTCGGGAAMAAYVEERRNCEDVLMNFVAAMASGRGPVLVGERRGRIRDWGDVRNEERGDGARIREVSISGIEGHRKRRGECIREFHKRLGWMPLRYSYGRVVDGVGDQGLCHKGGKLVFCDQQL